MMSLFKRRVSETEATATFVRHIFVVTRAEWDRIRDQLAPFLSESDRLTLNDTWTEYEFAVACIALEAQSVRNLLPIEQAQRIWLYLRDVLDAPELNRVGVEALAAYDAAWQSSLKAVEPPFSRLAGTFHDRAGLSSRVELHSVAFKDPMLLAALAVAMVTLGGGWWKAFLQRYKLVHRA